MNNEQANRFFAATGLTVPNNNDAEPTSPQDTSQSDPNPSDTEPSADPAQSAAASGQIGWDVAESDGPGQFFAQLNGRHW